VCGEGKKSVGKHEGTDHEATFQDPIADAAHNAGDTLFNRERD
jgi:hypothetical protein